MLRPRLARILIADDHELIREGLQRIYVKAGQTGEFGEARTAAEVLGRVRDENWDLVVLDLNLPGRGGLDVLKEIKAERPNLPVLVLSMYPEEHSGVRVLRAGADGYVTKSQPPEVIVEAMRRVVTGGKYISAGVAAKLAEALSARAPEAGHEALSDREDQVLRRIAAGEAVGEIAAALNLSVKTVSTYRANNLRKLGLRNNAQLMRYAHDHGLMD
jgi:DNA-binding NarL/FixJ family response regulator